VRAEGHLCPHCLAAKVKADRDAETRKKRAVTIVPKRFHDARIEHLDLNLIEAFNGLPDDIGLYLFGEPGRGKTYATAAIAYSFIMAGRSVVRIRYKTLCRLLRCTFQRNSKLTEEDVFKQYLLPDKLFIEDVGTAVKGVEKEESNFSRETFFELLDERLEWCRATFITTNKSLPDLATTFDERIASRVMQACVQIKLEGRDRRIKE